MERNNQNLLGKIIAVNLIVSGGALLVGMIIYALKSAASFHLSFAWIPIFACGLALILGGWNILSKTRLLESLDGLTLDDPVAFKGPAIIITTLVVFFMCIDPLRGVSLIALSKKSFSWLTPIQCLSYSWLHSTVRHVVGNSTTLTFFWLLGYNRLRDSQRWSAFILGIYGAGWVSFYCDPYTTVGCSGGVTALIGLTMYDTLRTGKGSSQGLFFIAGVLGFVIPSFAALDATFLDHSAHVAGLLVGTGVGLIFDPSRGHFAWMGDKQLAASRLGSFSKILWCAGAISVLLYYFANK